jgi:hypothetical protein
VAGEQGQEGQDREEPAAVGDLMVGRLAQPPQQLGAPGVGQAQDVALGSRGTGLDPAIEQAPVAVVCADDHPAERFAVVDPLGDPASLAGRVL